MSPDRCSATSARWGTRFYCSPGSPHFLPSLLGGFSIHQKPELQGSQLWSISLAQHSHEIAVPWVLQNSQPWIYLSHFRIDVSSLSNFSRWSVISALLPNPLLQRVICGKWLCLVVEDLPTACVGALAQNFCKLYL